MPPLLLAMEPYLLLVIAYGSRRSFYVLNKSVCKSIMLEPGALSSIEQLPFRSNFLKNHFVNNKMNLLSSSAVRMYLNNLLQF